MTFATDTMPVDILDDGTYRLTAPLVYQGRDETFTVPAGFVTDLASVPRFLSALVPIAGRFDRAAVIHDWLCGDLADAWASRGHVDYAPALATSTDTDGIFRRILRELGTPVVLRWLFYVGVRWGALANPARRAGWVRTAPQVAAISLAALPFVAPVAIVTALALAVGGIAEGIARIIGGEAVSTWPAGFDPLAWVYPSDLYGTSPQQLDDEGIAYLMCETMDGRPLAWAPLGTSGKPFEDGEGVTWKIRTVLQ